MTLYVPASLAELDDSNTIEHAALHRVVGP